jgi:hypothetical protein
VERLPLILICLVLIALLAMGCWTKASEDAQNNMSETTGESSGLESGGNPSDSGTTGDTGPASNGPDTPVSSEASFIIDEPSQGQLVKSGGEITIKGKTRVQKFSIEIEDGHNILGNAHVNVPVKSQELEKFEVTINLEKHTSPSGMIIFVTEDEAGKRQEELLLPIKFE